MPTEPASGPPFWVYHPANRTPSVVSTSLVMREMCPPEKFRPQPAALGSTRNSRMKKGINQ